MPPARSRWFHFLLNSVLLLLTVPSCLAIVWAFYLLVALVAEGSKNLSRLPFLPDWLGVLGVVLSVLILAAHVYYFRQGVYEDGNPLLRGRRSVKAEHFARHRALRRERQVDRRLSG